MLDWNKNKPGFDDQTELPLYNNHYSRKMSTSNSIGLTSRSTSHSPTASFTNLPPTYTDNPSPTHEKTQLSLRQSKKPHGDGSTEQAETPPSKCKVAAVILFYLVAAIVMVFANKVVGSTRNGNPDNVSVLSAFIGDGFAKTCGTLWLFGDTRAGLQDWPKAASSHFYQRHRPSIQHLLPAIRGRLLLPNCQRTRPALYGSSVLPLPRLSAESQHSVNRLSRLRGVPLGSQIGPSTYVKDWHCTRSAEQHNNFSHAIVVKRSLSVTSSAIELSYYNNLVSAVFLLPFIPFTSEIVTFRSLVSTGGQDLQTFMMGALVTGFFGFLISLAGFLSIKITSPITHMVSSAVRGVLQTILGTVLFGDVISSNRFIGIAVILGGSIAYTTIKDKESRPEKFSLTTRSRPAPPILPTIAPSKTPNNLTTLKVVC
ncbi:hypothetical protein PSHT_13549 [Puccinia striiformis]|uniref:Sugar phosphate transporter domain-containing protein n=1 Tax=Puccinia striiformis TaxID=27350 RepID=A0A2S4UQA4_9BASI|nr:hypothetical protein PSHT_13549 [Puccinia striiformis]